MFQSFQQKFRQRLSNVLISGVAWVNNTAPASMLLRLSGTYVPPPGAAPVTSDIIRLSRVAVGSYRIFLCPERTDRGMYFDFSASGVSIAPVLASTTLTLGNGSEAIALNAPLLRLNAGTTSLFVDTNSAVVLLTLGNSATAPGSDVTTGVTELRGKHACATATTNIVGGNLLLRAGNGASGSAGVASGGSVRIGAGINYGTGTAGQVQLGYDGTVVSRVTVRNTILALNGYTTTAAAATTTELPTAGDFGIHKNSSSGAVHLCFNDGGTIKSVQMT